MPFPEITVCVVCEAIRQEVDGKLSILGFWGILPHLEVPIGKKPKTLTFLLITGPMEGGTFRVSATLENPDRSLVVPPQIGELTFQPIPREMGAFLASSFNNVTIGQEGAYTFRVIVDDQPIFTQTFSAFRPA